MARTGEERIGIAVLRIAAARPDGVASYKRCYSELPGSGLLSAGDLALSKTRPGEPMFHQIVRNIRSHHDTEGNFIQRGLLQHVPKVGYRITEAGRAYLKGLS